MQAAYYYMILLLIYRRNIKILILLLRSIVNTNISAKIEIFPDAPLLLRLLHQQVHRILWYGKLETHELNLAPYCFLSRVVTQIQFWQYLVLLLDTNL